MLVTKPCSRGRPPGQPCFCHDRGLCCPALICTLTKTFEALPLLEHERIALAMIALITGMMGFIESMVAVPAASTALAADALRFVQHSVNGR